MLSTLSDRFICKYHSAQLKTHTHTDAFKTTHPYIYVHSQMYNQVQVIRYV